MGGGGRVGVGGGGGATKMMCILLHSDFTPDQTNESVGYFFIELCIKYLLH